MAMNVEAIHDAHMAYWDSPSVVARWRLAWVKAGELLKDPKYAEMSEADIWCYLNSGKAGG